MGGSKDTKTEERGALLRASDTIPDLGMMSLQTAPQNQMAPQSQLQKRASTASVYEELVDLADASTCEAGSKASMPSADDVASDERVSYIDRMRWILQVFHNRSDEHDFISSRAGPSQFIVACFFEKNKLMKKRQVDEDDFMQVRRNGSKNSVLRRRYVSRLSYEHGEGDNRIDRKDLSSLNRTAQGKQILMEVYFPELYVGLAEEEKRMDRHLNRASRMVRRASK